MKKEKTSILDFYNDDEEEVTEEEQEEIDSFMDEELTQHLKEKEKEETKLRKANQEILEKEYDTMNLEEFEIEDDFEEKRKKDKNPRSLKIMLNVILCVLFVMVILVIIDIVCVTKWNKGPYFAIPLHTYDDGGTTEYYGIGYKVIKYNQLQGRRDMEIGSWSLKYNVDPIYVDVVDLAIEFHDDPETAYQNYYKQLLIVNGSLKEVDQEHNKIVISYEDEGEKYSIDVVCNMETPDIMSILEPKYEVSAMGTMVGYDAKTKNKRAVIHLDNCFADQ